MRVLSVGSSEACNRVRDALLERQKCHLMAVESPSDLYSVSCDLQFDIAVLDASLSVSGLHNAGTVVRKRWPDCRILAIAHRAEDLDDPLYDEWTPPGMPQVAFIELLERVATEACRLRNARTRITAERRY